MSNKILIVEDEAITAMDLKNTLSMLDFEVVGIASRGNEAIQKIEEFKPDLILMDIVLKGDMDGIETSEIIKKRFNIPIVYLTAHSDDRTFQRAKLTEPYGFIIKPINHDGLKSTIEIALYKHELDKKLKENQEKFKLFYDDAPLPYQSLDESGHIIEVNQAWLDLLGYSQDEVIGRWFGDFIINPTIIFNENFPKFKANGEICNIQFEMKKKDGSLIIAEYNGKIGYNKDGEFIRTQCIFQDITKRKETEDLLQFQATILKNVKECIIVYDTQGRVRYWNEGAEELYGYSKEEMMDQSISKLYPDNEKLNIDHVIEMGGYQGENVFRKKDGSNIKLYNKDTLMHDFNGDIIGIIRISQPIK